MFDLSSRWQPYLTCHKIALGLAFTTKTTTRGSSNGHGRIRMRISCSWSLQNISLFPPVERTRVNSYLILLSTIQSNEFSLQRIPPSPSPPEPLFSPFTWTRWEKKKNSNEITRDTFIRRRREAKKTGVFFSIPPFREMRGEGGGEARNKILLERRNERKSRYSW